MQVIGSKKLTTQELSIRIFSDGFSFSASHTQKEVKAKKGESLLQALETAFSEMGLLRFEYDEVHVYADYPSTRIPLDEFRSEEVQAIYRLTFGADSLSGMNIHYEMLPALEVIEVFAIDAQIEKLILKYYPHATLHCYFGQLIDRMLSFEKRQKEPEQRLYVHSNGRQLFIFTYKEGKLQFANSFEAATLADQTYFLLYAWKQLGLRQRKDKCILIGKDKALEAVIRKYVNQVECV